MKWAIVEVFGHQKHAGPCADEDVLGVKMCVVVQPAFVRTTHDTDWYCPEEGEDGDEVRRRQRVVTETYPETRIELGASAIFRRTWVDEATARDVLPCCSWGAVRPQVVEGPWQDSAARVALPGPVEDAEEIADDDSDLNVIVPQPEDCGREMVPDDAEVS